MGELYNMKGHPIFDQILAFNGRKVFYDLVEKISEKKTLTNKEMDESLVFKALDSMIEDENGTFHTIIKEGTELYRCRKISDVKEIGEGGIDSNYTDQNVFYTIGYDEPNSKEAPLHKAAAARANIEGASYLYLAEEPYTACAEIRPDNHSYVSLATFRITKEAKIIDLKTDQKVAAFVDFEKEHDLSIASLFTEVMRFFSTPSIHPSVYLTTELIADHMRKAGFDGIRFQSSVSGGSNITLFNSHRSRIKFVESHVILVHALKYNMVNLDNGLLFEPPTETDWNPGNLPDARNELIKMVLNSKSKK